MEVYFFLLFYKNLTNFLIDGKKKDLAKPFTKIEATVNNRGKPENEKKKEINNKNNEIWDENEITEIPISKNETRPRPEYEVFIKKTTFYHNYLK